MRESLGSLDCSERRFDFTACLFPEAFDQARHSGDGRLLVGMQRTDETDVERFASISLITQFAADVGLAQQFLGGIQEPRDRAMCCG